MAPVATRQIEASDLPWPHQKVAEQLEAASPATPIWMVFGASVDASPTQDNQVLNDGDLLCRDPASRTIQPWRNQAQAIFEIFCRWPQILNCCANPALLRAIEARENQR
jgi:hypothetical protein